MKIHALLWQEMILILSLITGLYCTLVAWSSRINKEGSHKRLYSFLIGTPYRSKDSGVKKLMFESLGRKSSHVYYYLSSLFINILEKYRSFGITTQFSSIPQQCLFLPFLLYSQEGKHFFYVKQGIFCQKATLFHSVLVLSVKNEKGRLACVIHKDNSSFFLFPAKVVWK